MAYTSKSFKEALEKSGIESIKFWPGWKKTFRGMSWRSRSKAPVALLLHHTASAQTRSKRPSHPGNQTDADYNIARYVNRHPAYDVPASQFTLRRSGHLDVNAYKPVFHGGIGSFRKTKWNGLGIPDNAINSYALGIEIVSKGDRGTDDLTEAQWKTLALLIQALEPLCGWKNTGTFYLPRHRDWAPKRKPDIRASNKKVQEKLAQYAVDRYWDGKTPLFSAVEKCEKDRTLASSAACRVACKLADDGFYKGEPLPKYSQRYPSKAMRAFNDVHFPGAGDSYSEATHKALFG